MSDEESHSVIVSRAGAEAKQVPPISAMSPGGTSIVCATVCAEVGCAGALTPTLRSRHLSHLESTRPGLFNKMF